LGLGERHPIAVNDVGRSGGALRTCCAGSPAGALWTGLSPVALVALWSLSSPSARSTRSSTRSCSTRIAFIALFSFIAFITFIPLDSLFALRSDRSHIPFFATIHQKGNQCNIDHHQFERFHHHISLN